MATDRPGPWVEGQSKIKVGDIVASTKLPVFIGGHSKIIRKPIRLKPPLDQAENGTGWNNNSEKHYQHPPIDPFAPLYP